MTREVLRDHAREETHGVGLLITRLQGMFAKVSVHACTVFSSQRTSALSFYEVIFGNLCCLPLLKENVVGGLSQLALYQCGLHVSRHIKICFFFIQHYLLARLKKTTMWGVRRGELKRRTLPSVKRIRMKIIRNLHR